MLLLRIETRLLLLRIESGLGSILRHLGVESRLRSILRHLGELLLLGIKSGLGSIGSNVLRHVGVESWGEVSVGLCDAGVKGGH